MDSEKFLDKVAERAGVTREKAEALTRATLQTLAERISGGEAQDLAEQLPEPMRDWLRRTDDELAKGFGLHSFIRRVSDRAGVPQAEATEGVKAVLAALREAVTGKEFRDATAQLPEEYEPVLPPRG